MPDLLTAENHFGSLSSHDSHQVYNGLDTCITLEVFEALASQRDNPEAELTYNFCRAMQAPALEMMLRGIRVDQFHRWNYIRELESKADKVQIILNEFSEAVWNRPINPNSPHQLKQFFYEALGLPEQYKIAKGERKLSTDREALEKLSLYFHAEPFVNCILKIKELLKKASVLRSEVDPDDRMRTSYNVAGTETERWSSSKNVHGGGTNLQNITEELRRVFVADPGKKLAYIDLAQAESRALGWLCWVLFGKSHYLDACESGDLHTTVAKLVWPDLGWSGDPQRDKALAEAPFYRHFSYRDMSKRGGHGTNYYGTARTMARHLKVAQRLIEDFQFNYFAAFPDIKDYHRWVARNIQLDGRLSTPLGTGRYFFGRLTDDTTLREAIAYVPQHMVGVLLNLALWRVWYYAGRKVDILAQVHDAILIQYPEEKEEEILPEIIPLMATELEHNGRKMVIPSDVVVGWNWAKYYDEPMAAEDVRKGRKPKLFNLDGLRGWKQGKPDTRQRTEDPEAARLDRRFPGVYRGPAQSEAVPALVGHQRDSG